MQGVNSNEYFESFFHLIKIFAFYETYIFSNYKIKLIGKL